MKKLPIEFYSIKHSPKQCKIDLRRGADYNVLMWIEKGSGNFCVDGDEFTLGEGDGIFIRHDVPCTYWGENLATSWCSFFSTEEFLNYVMDDTRYFTYKMTDNLKEEERFMRSYVNDGTDETVDTSTYETRTPNIILNGKTTPIALSVTCYSFVSMYLETVMNKADNVIIKINAYLEANFPFAISLDDVADAVGMDKFSMCKNYKQKCGTTIMDELLKIRIGKAKRMLRYGNDSIEYIGKACGFETPSYFCKKFRLLVGSTPLQYRKKHM